MFIRSIVRYSVRNPETTILFTRLNLPFAQVVDLLL